MCIIAQSWLNKHSDSLMQSLLSGDKTTGLWKASDGYLHQKKQEASSQQVSLGVPTSVFIIVFWQSISIPTQSISIPTHSFTKLAFVKHMSKDCSIERIDFQWIDWLQVLSVSAVIKEPSRINWPIWWKGYLRARLSFVILGDGLHLCSCDHKLMISF